MIVVFYILFVLLFLYAVILFWLAIGFLKTKILAQNNVKIEPVTIIICARNEQDNVTACLTSLLKQDYNPAKIQLIFINDASSDLTVQIAESILKKSSIDYKIISNKTRKGKKQSIAYALGFANHELIVLRDADTFTSSDQWLSTIASFYKSTNADLIIAPIAIANHSVLLWALQAIENNILSVLACGSSYYKKPFLCNGANLIFTKTIFEKANGYNSHLNRESGDDIFFMEDVKKIPGSKIHYLKSVAAIVHTYPCFSFKTLLAQKIRWASKFKAGTNVLNSSLAVLIFIINAGWVFSFVASCFSSDSQNIAFKFIIIKLLIDILLLFLSSTFIKNKNLLWFSLPAGCVYPVYSCVVAIGSLFIKPRWKN